MFSKIQHQIKYNLRTFCREKQLCDKFLLRTIQNLLLTKLTFIFSSLIFNIYKTGCCKLVNPATKLCKHKNA